jgi:hypothetical protein
MDYLLIVKIGLIRHLTNWLNKAFIRKIGVVEWKGVWFMKIEEKFNRNHTGVPYRQLVDMVNWWIRVTTPVCQQAIQINQAQVYRMIFLLRSQWVALCNLSPSALITFQIVPNSGLPSPESALYKPSRLMPVSLASLVMPRARAITPKLLAIKAGSLPASSIHA